MGFISGPIFHFHFFVKFAVSFNVHHRVQPNKSFSSSSAHPPSPTRPSTAPRSRRSCRRRPNSPPTNASRRSGSRLLLLWSSLCVVSLYSSRMAVYQAVVSVMVVGGLYNTYPLRGNPQTRHPPRAVRRASAVGGVGWCLLSPRRRLWLWTGFPALRRTWLQGCLWVFVLIWFGELVRIRLGCLVNSMFRRRCSNRDDDARRALGPTAAVVVSQARLKRPLATWPVRLFETDTLHSRSD